MNLKKLFQRIYCWQPKSQRAGFTLIEVLAAAFTSTIIVTAALGAAIQVGSNERNERILSESDTEIQRALDLISEELSRAVYVYNGQQLADRGDIDGLNASFNIVDGLTPVLAFWVSETLPYPNTGESLPANCSNVEASTVECNETLSERRAFSLIIYLIDDTNTTNFEGQAAIRRFQLRKYLTVSDLNPNDISSAGKTFVDPVKNSQFPNWPFDESGVDLQNVQIPISLANAPIVVDFIDDPDPNAPTATTDTDLLACADQDIGVGDPEAAGVFENFYTDKYRPSPVATADMDTLTSTSFFACVREIDFVNGEGNQDVMVFIRGNPDGRDGYQYVIDGATPLPTARTQRVTLGSIDKTAF